MARDGKYGVTMTINVNIEVSLTTKAEDEDEAHDKALDLVESFIKRLNRDASIDGFEILDMNTIDTTIDEIEELEAPVTDEEEE